VTLSRLSAAAVVSAALFGGARYAVAQCRPAATLIVTPAPTAVPNSVVASEWSGRPVILTGQRPVRSVPTGSRGQRDCCKRKDPSCCPQRYCCHVK
jgi:hypothetical protein